MKGTRAGRQGFTIIEMLTTLTIIGILAGVAVPTIRGPIAKADAASITADFSAVRHMAYEFLEENGRFPVSGTLGSVPAEMVGDVPAFQYKGMDYYWLSIDLRNTDTSPYSINALGLFVVYFNGNTEVADVFRDRPVGWSAPDVIDYAWSPDYALFLMLE